MANENLEVKDDDAEAGEETQPAFFKRDHMLPSSAEVEQHRTTHLPYRSWCRECIEGRALGEKRDCRPGREKLIPVVG